MTPTSTPAPALPLVDRHFLRLANDRLAHYREVPADGRRGQASGAPPLVIAHAGPGSSQGLVPLMQQLGGPRRVLAPDMPGNGDSEPLALAQPEIADYADHLVQLLDRLGIAQIDFCGQHTGAHIGCELALRHPGRVRRLVLDGMALFAPALRSEFQARYAPQVAPDDFGGHLAWTWQFVGDMMLHFPYYQRDPAHRLHNAMPPAAVRQALVVEVLKALPSYHLAYQAAFRHPAAERLALLTQHTTLFLAADGDPLGVYLEAATALVAGARSARMARADRAPVIAAFLDSL